MAQVAAAQAAGEVAVVVASRPVSTILLIGGALTIGYYGLMKVIPVAAEANKINQAATGVVDTVVNGIGGVVKLADQARCRNDLGKSLWECEPGRAMGRDQCKPGYYEFGGVCWESCAPGERDDGAFCWNYDGNGGNKWFMRDHPDIIEQWEQEHKKDYWSFQPKYI